MKLAYSVLARAALIAVITLALAGGTQVGQAFAAGEATITGHLSSDANWSRVPNYLAITAYSQAGDSVASWAPGGVYYAGEQYTLVVPAGTYELDAGSASINHQKKTVTVAAGETRVVDFDLVCDVTPPSTVEENLSSMTWYRSVSDLQAHFVATDDLTGIYELSWSINGSGSCVPAHPHSTTFAFMTAQLVQPLDVDLSLEPWVEGANTLEFYSRDCGEYWTDLPSYNVEYPRPTKKVFLDWSAPTVSGGLQGYTGPDGPNAGLTWSFDVSDAVSGPGLVYWRRAGETSWRLHDPQNPEAVSLQHGDNRFEYFAEDRAGNPSAIRSVSYMDNSPVLTGTVTDASTGAPIQSAWVGVFQLDGASVAEGYTGADGSYALQGVPNPSEPCRVVIADSAGVHSASVRTVDLAAVGGVFDVSLEPSAQLTLEPDAYEADEMATPISVDGSPQHRTMTADADYDEVRLDALKGATYTIERYCTGFISSEGMNLVDVSILDGQGNLLASTSGVRYSRLTWTAPQSGTYRIVVQQVMTGSESYDITAVTDGLGEVSFPDPRLEARVRQITGVATGPVREKDLEPFSTFTLRGAGVTSLEGIQYARNLTVLDAQENSIVDVTPLAAMPKLVNVNLTLNQIVDISPLASLKSLSTLYLRDNRVSDVTPLRSLPLLNYMRLDYNEISDLTPLVQNPAIGAGDSIYLAQNYLDATPGSKDMTDAQILRSRGAYLSGDVFQKPLPVPTTTASLSPSAPDGSNGWYRSVPAVTLGAQNASSTVYWWDASVSPLAYTAPLAPASGAHTLNFRSQNYYGNEPTRSVSIKVDTESPTPPPTLEATRVAPTTLRLNWGEGSDAISGVAGYQVSVNGVRAADSIAARTLDVSLIDRYGVAVIDVATVDAAGNVGIPHRFMVDLGALNSAPTSTAQSATLAEDVAREIALSAQDVDGDPLTYAVASAPQHGTLSGISGNRVTYTPQQDYNGSDSFSFVASDGRSSSAPATVSLTVTPVNDVPVATPVSATTVEDAPTTLVLSGADADGDALAYAIAVQPAHGTLSAVAGDRITYTPSANYHGSDSFSFVASDGKGQSAPVEASLLVTPVNDAPVAFSQAVAVSEDTTKAITLAGDDVDGDALTYAIVAPPTHGTLSTVSNGNVVYTPDTNFVGSDSFSFRVSDGALQSLPQTVTIQVAGANDAPVANPGAAATDEDVACVVTLSASDADRDALTYAITSQPAHGRLSAVSGNQVTYTPDANYHGADTFAFEASDGRAASAPAAISIAVASVNDAPVARPASVETPEGTGREVQLLGSDVDGDVLAFRIAEGPAHGTLSAVSGGMVTYTPAPGYFGADAFTFTASDGVALSEAAAISISVTEVNSVPVANSQSVSTRRGTACEVVLSATDSDGDALSYTVATAPTHGTLSQVVDGHAVYTPAAGFTGMDSFTFTVFDGVAASEPATVSIEVTSPPTGPATVTLPSSGIQLGFESTDDVGESQATPTTSHSAPANFRILRGSYFDISTTANFTGNVLVTIPYDPAELNGANESNLKLFHWKNNGWEDITVSVDTANHTVTGRTTSFSPFAVVAPASTGGGSGGEVPVVTTPASSNWSLALLTMIGCIAIVGFSVMRRRRSDA